MKLFLLMFVCNLLILAPSRAYINRNPHDTTLFDSRDNVSREELIIYIDSLFELDSIPYDKIAVVNRYVNEQFPSPEISLPASYYYSTWNTKGQFHQEQFAGGDSGEVLVLAGNYRKFCMPVSGIITSKFGWRDSSNHHGIDIDLRKGEPVRAAFDGKVRFSGRKGAYGNVVIIRHFNGLETVYAHLSKINVKAEQLVKAADIIGLGGSTGRSTGPHLHFETRFRGYPVNPHYFIEFNEEMLVSNRVRIKKKSSVVSVLPEGIDFHVIERGDSWYRISQRYGIPIKQLKSRNAQIKFKVGTAVKII